MHRIAFLGLGIMGSRMASRLLAAGFHVTVWNRTLQRAGALHSQGADVAASPSEAVANADVAMTMLGDPASVKEVALGRGGVVESLAVGRTYVDMTTVDPDTTRAIDCACKARGISFLEAPVTGSKLAAANGELVLMVGGPAETLESLRPLLKPLAKHIVRMGPVGSGATMKLVNNLAIAGSMVALFEAMTLGRRAGLSDHDIQDVLTHSALASPLLALKSHAAIARDFEPHFAFKHMAKDIRLAVKEAATLDIELPFASQLNALFARGLEAGYDDEDFAALIKVVEQVAGGDVSASRQ